MSLLLNRDLIEECGRLQVPGRPRLYRTTKQFLRAFHLNSLEDLPELAEPSEAEDPLETEVPLEPETGGQMRLGENGEIMDSKEEETE